MNKRSLYCTIICALLCSSAIQARHTFFQYERLQRCADGQFLVSVSNTTDVVQRVCLEVYSDRTGEKIRKIYRVAPGGLHHVCMSGYRGMYSYHQPDFDVYTLKNHKGQMGQAQFAFEPHWHPQWPIANVVITNYSADA